MSGTFQPPAKFRHRVRKSRQKKNARIKALGASSNERWRSRLPLFHSALYRALADQRLRHGIDDHEYGAIAFFKVFPNQHLVNNPYKTMPAQGDWTLAKRAADKSAELIGGTGTLSNRRRTWFLAAWPLKLG
jgi:hypothetical protein